jgi:hypothetical protein
MMLSFLSSVSFQLFLCGCFCPGVAYLRVISGFYGSLPPLFLPFFIRFPFAFIVLLRFLFVLPFFYG